MESSLKSCKLKFEGSFQVKFPHRSQNYRGSFPVISLTVHSLLQVFTIVKKSHFFVIFRKRTLFSIMLKMAWASGFRDTVQTLRGLKTGCLFILSKRVDFGTIYGHRTRCKQKCSFVRSSRRCKPRVSRSAFDSRTSLMCIRDQSGQLELLKGDLTCLVWITYSQVPNKRVYSLNYCNVELLALTRAKISTLQQLSEYTRLLGT